MFFTEPEFIMRQKFRGQDLYEILSDEEHNHLPRLLFRGLHAILYSLVYYPISLIVIPLVILWAINNEVGFQIVSFIAIAAVLALLLQFALWLWRTIFGNKGKADILMDDGKRYRGKLISENKVVGVDVTLRDVTGNIHLEGILLEEDDDRVKFVTSDGLRTANKNPYDLIHMEKETSIHAEIELKDGSRKIGKKIYILGEKPFKEFLVNFPDLILVLYLWYLVVVQLIN
jgi:hypothetical protein